MKPFDLRFFMQTIAIGFFVVYVEYNINYIYDKENFIAQATQPTFVPALILRILFMVILAVVIEQLFSCLRKGIENE